MKIFYSVEANNMINHVPEFIQLIKSETTVFEIHDSTFIFDLKVDAIHAVGLLKEVDFFENETELIQVTKGKKGDTFDDFGFETTNAHYLIKELLCAFSIIGGESDAIQMATYQLEEHLVFTANEGNTQIFFVENHLMDLVSGIAKAYDIEVSFFDLDK